ncbi:TIGR02270 family protein [Archangium sp.]|uniref:TIGR02270 family protein n=1 Tax=Archangium sp. TaxID=1872627 RepID=UPI002D67E2D9|nr:TIGR02270 family protein [Archangium sp.]HYO56127.1 TIGR02270 family protein [Archangium sp.]
MLLTRPDRLLRWDVLEEHLDEAAFLWAQWEQALWSAAYTLSEVEAGPEGRMRAHLEALVMGGRRVTERFLKPALAGDDVECIRTAAFALLAEGEEADVDAVLRVLTEGEEAGRAAVQRALEVSEWKALDERLRPLLDTEAASVQAAALEVLRFRRIYPGPVLLTLLTHEAQRVRTAAWRAACLWPEKVSPETVRRALDSSDVASRSMAVELGLMHGMRVAWKCCQELVESAGASGRMARVLLAMGGEPGDVEWLTKLLEVHGLRRDVLWALGFSGRVAAAEACIPWLGDEEVGGTAAEAFCSITGLPLEEEFVRESPEEPSEEPIPFDEEALDAELVPGPDPELVLLEPAAVERWWGQARKDFEPKGRYLGGNPLVLGRLMEALGLAPMRRRPMLALELAIRSRGRHQVETRAFSSVQKRQLEAVHSLHGGSFSMGPFSNWIGG